MSRRNMMLAYGLRDRDRVNTTRPERMTVNNYYGESYSEPIMDKFRDSRGRQHYDNGRFAPMNREYYIWTDGYNFPYREEMQEMAREREYERMREPEMRYGDYMENTYKPVMGFAGGSQMRYNMPVPMDEMSHRGGKMERGYGNYDGYSQPLNKQTAEKWLRSMRNSDGTTGEHWTMEQTTPIMQQKGYACDPMEFWVAMNMMYSDYYKVAKRMNINTPDFYASLAEAFLCDDDAVEDKLSKYYASVVEK